MAIKIKGKSKQAVRGRRHLRVRKKITGTATRPRLVINRSSRHIFAQLVDDSQSKTLFSASTLEADLRNSSDDKTTQAKRVGEIVAERAKEQGIETVVFDRSGYRYHGRIAAVAEGAREGGLAL